MRPMPSKAETAEPEACQLPRERISLTLRGLQRPHCITDTPLCAAHGGGLFRFLFDSCGLNEQLKAERLTAFVCMLCFCCLVPHRGTMGPGVFKPWAQTYVWKEFWGGFS